MPALARVGRKSVSSSVDSLKAHSSFSAGSIIPMPPRSAQAMRRSPLSRRSLSCGPALRPPKSPASEVGSPRRPSSSRHEQGSCLVAGVARRWSARRRRDRRLATTSQTPRPFSDRTPGPGRTPRGADPCPDGPTRESRAPRRWFKRTADVSAGRQFDGRGGVACNQPLRPMFRRHSPL
jgi:hypothetical protein